MAFAATASDAARAITVRAIPPTFGAAAELHGNCFAHQALAATATPGHAAWGPLVQMAEEKIYSNSKESEGGIGREKSFAARKSSH